MPCFDILFLKSVMVFISVSEDEDAGFEADANETFGAVSYTHLDVYKRQFLSSLKAYNYSLKDF